MTIKQLYNQVGKFCDKNFPDATAVSHLRKLKKEVNEAIDSPNDLSEYSDCLLALFAAANKAGFSYKKLLFAACFKHVSNTIREWEKLPDGTYQHVK